MSVPHHVLVTGQGASWEWNDVPVDKATAIWEILGYPDRVTGTGMLDRSQPRHGGFDLDGDVGDDRGHD